MPAGVLEASTCGGGHDQALPVLHDAQRAAPGHDPYRLGVDGGLAGVGGEHPALGLGDDLRGDQDDVAVGQRGGGGRDQLGEVVALADLGQPGDGPDLEGGCGAHARTSSARASASRAMAAVASRSVIISGTARQRMPAASTSATAPVSALSTSQPSSSPEP